MITDGKTKVLGENLYQSNMSITNFMLRRPTYGSSSWMGPTWRLVEHRYTQLHV